MNLLKPIFLLFIPLFASELEIDEKLSRINPVAEFLRILNDENEVSFYYGNDGKTWKRLERPLMQPDLITMYLVVLGAFVLDYLTLKMVR